MIARVVANFQCRQPREIDPIIRGYRFGRDPARHVVDIEAIGVRRERRPEARRAHELGLRAAIAYSPHKTQRASNAAKGAAK